MNKQKANLNKINKKRFWLVALIIYLILGALFIIMVISDNNNQPQAKVIPGENLDEALFLNQCKFYNFILAGNGDPRRFNCPDEIYNKGGK